MLKIVIFRRLSKEKQKGNQYGFDSQDFEIDMYLRALREPYKVVGEFQEFFTGTGWYENRPEFFKAVQLCEKTGATLVVQKADRFARNVASGSILMEKINVVFANMPTADTMTKHVLLAMAEQEAKNISVRTKAALHVAMHENGVKVGAANEKYYRDPKTHKTTQQTKHHSKYEQFRKIFTQQLTKGVSPTKLTIKLNDLGITTPKGGMWTPTQTIRAIKYLGLGE